jgi:hypothetical protein
MHLGGGGVNTMVSSGIVVLPPNSSLANSPANGLHI